MVVVGDMVMFDQSKRDTIWERVRVIPIVETLSMKLVEFKEGYCRISVPYDRRYDGIYKSFHGGLLMTIADSVACFAIMTQAGLDDHLTTTDMNIRFLAPCLSDVDARATVIKLGKTLCPVSVDLFDQSGIKVAVAQVTYIRLTKRPSHTDADKNT